MAIKASDHFWSPQVLMLAFAVLLIGIGQIAALPPFEGFDETAHYSSIRQIADTGMIPLLGKSFIAQEVVDYRKAGPIRYAVTKPYDDNGGFTYQTFFSDAARIDNYKKNYREPAPRAPFTPSTEDNWQAQHPPLYYLLMAPVMKMTDGLSFIDQFFVLRLVSFLLAGAGMLIGLWGTLEYGEPRMRSTTILAFFVYPIIVPQFFPEFGRIGNDSLCLLIMGVAWALLLRWLKDEFNSGLTFALGITLGFGLLTKALFMPVIAGIGGFLLLRLWKGRSDRKLLRDRFDMLSPLALPIFFASAWYVYKWKAYGTIDASWETALLASKGGVLSNLSHISLNALLVAFISTTSSWVWAGTASLTTARAFHLAFLAFDIWLLIGYIKFARRQSEPAVWIPVFVLSVFSLALLHHVIMMIAAIGRGETPGWYASILLPVFAYAFALAINGQTTRGRRIFLSGIAIGFVFLVIVHWLQISLFAGCAVSDDNKYHKLPNYWACLDRVDEVIARENVLGNFSVSVVSVACGIMLYGVGLRDYLRELST